ncbi:hypothetical protein JOQ06_011144, partial [Pogonophryne albipinna]
MILSSKKLPELWDYFLIYVSGALEFNPDCNDVDLGMFPLRMNPTIKTSTRQANTSPHNASTNRLHKPP